MASIRLQLPIACLLLLGITGSYSAAGASGEETYLSKAIENLGSETIHSTEREVEFSFAESKLRSATGCRSAYVAPKEIREPLTVEFAISAIKATPERPLVEIRPDGLFNEVGYLPRRCRSAEDNKFANRFMRLRLQWQEAQFYAAFPELDCLHQQISETFVADDRDVEADEAKLELAGIPLGGSAVAISPSLSMVEQRLAQGFPSDGKMRPVTERATRRDDSYLLAKGTFNSMTLPFNR